MTLLVTKHAGGGVTYRFECCGRFTERSFTPTWFKRARPLGSVPKCPACGADTVCATSFADGDALPSAFGRNADDEYHCRQRGGAIAPQEETHVPPCPAV